MVFVLDIVFDELFRDDGFGGEGVDFFVDGFGDEFGGGDVLVFGFDELLIVVVVVDVILESVDINLDEYKESFVVEFV